MQQVTTINYCQIMYIFVNENNVFFSGKLFSTKSANGGSGKRVNFSTLGKLGVPTAIAGAGLFYLFGRNNENDKNLPTFTDVMTEKFLVKAAAAPGKPTPQANVNEFKETFVLYRPL